MRLCNRLPLKTLLCCAIALAGLCGVHAQDPAKVVPAAATKAPPVPLLWKVSDHDNEVYLLGSFHLLKPDDYPLSRDVDIAFADAEKVVFELPPEEMSSPQLGVQMAQAAMQANGKTLNDELTPAVVAKLDAWTGTNADALQKMQLSPQALQMFEPWFVGLMVTITELTKQGLDPKLGLDAHLAARAGKASKPTTGFETGAEQIAFLDGMGREEQLQFLDEALSESEEGREEMRKLHDAWRAGDADTLWNEMALEMRRRYPQLYRRINVERNDAWLPEIEQRLKSGGSDDTLVVVGALHLLGEDGVVEKLRAKGYEVRRICSACRNVGSSYDGALRPKRAE